MAFVQAVSTGNTSTATSVTTGAITVTAGHAVVLFGVISPGGNAFGSFSTSKSDSLSTIGSLATASGGSINAAVITSAVGGSTTFTVTTTGANSTYFYLGVAEFNGRSGAIDQAASAYITTFVTSHASPTNPNPVLAGDDLVAFINDANNGGTETFTATSPWAIASGSTQTGAGGNLPPGCILYQNGVASSAYTANYTTAQFVNSANFIFGLPTASGHRNNLLLLGVS